MNLDSMQEIVAAARREGKRFWEIIPVSYTHLRAHETF